MISVLSFKTSGINLNAETACDRWTVLPELLWVPEYSESEFFRSEYILLVNESCAISSFADNKIITRTDRVIIISRSQDYDWYRYKYQQLWSGSPERSLQP